MPSRNPTDVLVEAMYVVKRERILGLCGVLLELLHDIDEHKHPSRQVCIRWKLITLASEMSKCNIEDIDGLLGYLEVLKRQLVRSSGCLAIQEKTREYCESEIIRISSTVDNLKCIERKINSMSFEITEMFSTLPQKDLNLSKKIVRDNVAVIFNF